MFALIPKGTAQYFLNLTSCNYFIIRELKYRSGILTGTFLRRQAKGVRRTTTTEAFYF